MQRTILTKTSVLMLLLCLLLAALPAYAQESAEAASTDADGALVLIRLVLVAGGLAAVLAVGGMALLRTRQGKGDLD
jgi:hypothetical protein